MLRVIITLLLAASSIAFSNTGLFYSIQLATFEREASARMFLNKLPEDIKAKAFIYITDKGKYTVRIGLANSIKELLSVKEHLHKRGFKDALIVPSSPDKVIKDNKREHENLVKTDTQPVQELRDILRRKEIIQSEKLEPFVKELDKEIRELKMFIHELTSGEELPLKKYKNPDSYYLKTNAELKNLYSKRLPLHLTGEFRYREKAPYEEDTIANRWFAYLGIRFSLLEEGVGEHRFKEKEYLIKEKISRFLLSSRFSYSMLLETQTELIEKAFVYEKKAIYKRERRIRAKLKELMDELSKIDKSYSFKLGRYMHAEVKEAGKTGSLKGRILPLIDVDLKAVKEVIKEREEKAKRIFEDSHFNTGWLEAYKDSNLDLYLRYYVADADGVLHYISAGVRFKMPLPFDAKRAKDISKLELISLKEEFLLRVRQDHSQILDYAVRMKQNYTNALNNLNAIKRELLEIDRELFLWKTGAGKVNYEAIFRNITDIFSRLDLIATYKYLNTIYANRIISLLGREYTDRAKELFHAGL